MVRAALVLSLLLGSLSAAAFDDVPSSREPRLAQREGPRPRLSPKDRERIESEVRRKLQTFVAVELSSRLGLDDATALKLSDAIRAHRDAQQEARRKVREETDKLAALVRDGASDEALRAQTARVLSALEAQPALDDLARETAKFLTPTQQAKLLLAFPDVMRDVRTMMRDARRGRGGPGGRGPRPAR